jgi:hypothetical protein
MERRPKLIFVSPTSVDGSPGRIVTYPDGSAVIQKWQDGEWVADKKRVASPSKPEPVGEETLTDLPVPQTAD